MTVKKSIESACFLSLLKEKESLSKGQEIHYDSLKTQSYLLSDSGLSIESMRRIYHIRCRELHVRANYPSAFSDTNCPSPGCQYRDTQIHLFVSSCFSDRNQIMTKKTRYKDIFGCDIQAQVIVMKIMFRKFENRRLCASPSDGGLPEDPRRKALAPRLGIQKAKLKSKRKKNKTRGLTA